MAQRVKNNPTNSRVAVMSKVGLAIVGCGTISQLNVPGYLEHPNCEIVALCDINEDRAIAKAKKPFEMAEAMKFAVLAGRKSFLSGRIQPNLFGSASTSNKGLI